MRKPVRVSRLCGDNASAAGRAAGERAVLRSDIRGIGGQGEHGSPVVKVFNVSYSIQLTDTMASLAL